jgi:hypothetical protein
MDGLYEHYHGQNQGEKMSEKSDNMFPKIKRWCTEDNIFDQKLPPQAGIKWAMQLKYPFNHPAPVPITIVQPAGMDFIIVQLAIKLDPRQVETLNRIAAMDKFYSRLKRMFLEHEVMYTFDEKNQAWVMVKQIHYDGLSKDRLFETFQRIFNFMVFGGAIYEEVINEP